MHTSPRTILVRLAALILSTVPPAGAGVLAAAHGAAQDAAPPAADLEQEVSQFPALGVGLRLPRGATLHSSALGTARQSLIIIPESRDWQLRVLDRRSSDVSLTPRRIVDQLIEELRASRSTLVDGEPVGSLTEIRDREDDLRLGDAPAARFYAAIPDARGEEVVAGYTVATVEPGRFLIFQLDASAAKAPDAIPVYEAVVESAQLRDPAEAALERSAMVRSGDALLDEFEASEYAALLPESDRWYRLHRPDPEAPGGSREVAYQRISLREGQRGELHPERPRTQWGLADRDRGLIAQIDAKTITEGRTIDSRSIFFAVPGRSEKNAEESWTVRMTIRDGASDPATWTETGARVGNRLTVSVATPTGPGTDKSWLVPDEAYLSQVEIQMLPRMLAASGAPMLFGFYAYTSNLGEIKLRREALEAATPASLERAGMADWARDHNAAPSWILRRTVGEGSPEQIFALDEEGDVLLGRLPGGVVMEPSDPETIQRIWREKGLTASQENRRR